jgi:hypothetical protein
MSYLPINMLQTPRPETWAKSTNDWYSKSTVTTNNDICILFHTGHSFCGKIANGKRNGYGTYCWNDSSRYEGEFRDDKPYGEGTYYDATGYSQKVTN